MQQFSTRLVEDAQKARELQAMLAYPSDIDFKTVVKSNMLKNFSVKAEDIDMANKIYRPSVASLKGRTTHKKGETVVTDYTEVPRNVLRNHQKLTVSADI
eukprot:7794328-Ditylum_brightwellii.AAC.1